MNYEDADRKYVIRHKTNSDKKKYWGHRCWESFDEAKQYSLWEVETTPPLHPSYEWVEIGLRPLT